MYAMRMLGNLTFLSSLSSLSSSLWAKRIWRKQKEKEKEGEEWRRETSREKKKQVKQTGKSKTNLCYTVIVIKEVSVQNPFIIAWCTYLFTRERRSRSSTSTSTSTRSSSSSSMRQKGNYKPYQSEWEGEKFLSVNPLMNAGPFVCIWLFIAVNRIQNLGYSLRIFPLLLALRVHVYIFALSLSFSFLPFSLMNGLADRLTRPFTLSSCTRWTSFHF